MMHPMDNVGWNCVRGRLLHPATIDKRRHFAKSLLPASGFVNRERSGVESSTTDHQPGARMGHPGVEGAGGSSGIRKGVSTRRT